MADVRTRIAPAPSGSIHVGNARAALYNWLFARRHGGVFVLRVEDTDHERVTDDYFSAVLEDLRWLGLQWDEGPEVGGPFGSYRQSERIERYQGLTTDFLELGRAYRCYCTQEEVKERARTAATAGAKPRPGYDGHCRALTDDLRRRFEAEGRSAVVRFKVPSERKIGFDDVVRGRIETDTEHIPDFVIQRSDGSPVYMLAAAADDAFMNITHIIRGEDLIAATPRQLLIREAMGITDVPVFGHLPLLVDERGRPLSKRWGDVSVRAYRDRGFLPQAMVNYLALLGWSYDDHTNIFSIAELVELFSLERVARNPATFDVAKLEWLNLHYIKQMSANDLAEQIVPFCVRAGIPADSPHGRSLLSAVAPLLVERLRRLEEAPPMVRFLFERVPPDDKARRAVEGNEDYLVAAHEALASEALAGADAWTSAAIEEALRSLAEERALKPKQAFQPIRAAVMGTLVSPPLFESLAILGRAETLERLAVAAEV